MTTDEQRAIEFAEYMAKSAEGYMATVDDFWDFGDELTESMLDKLRDKSCKLQSAIYEFRKRVHNAKLSRANVY